MRATPEPSEDAGAVETASTARGNVKATREDWIAAATEALIERGVEQVKILPLSERLDVSRSSFYWYFQNRAALLDALLESWSAQNTRSFVEACAAPADTVTGAVCNLFRCFIDPSAFDPRLDFAIRDWARRAPSVRTVVDEADAARVAALIELFARHGEPPDKAETRARILYYMQIGYYALELRESVEDRLARVAGYLEGFTGHPPRPEEIAALAAHARAAQAKPRPRRLEDP